MEIEGNAFPHRPVNWWPHDGRETPARLDFSAPARCIPISCWFCPCPVCWGSRCSHRDVSLCCRGLVILSAGRGRISPQHSRRWWSFLLAMAILSLWTGGNPDLWGNQCKLACIHHIQPCRCLKRTWSHLAGLLWSSCYGPEALRDDVC